MYAAVLNRGAGNRRYKGRDHVIAGRGGRSEGSRLRPTTGRRTRANTDCFEAASMCAAGMNEVHEVVRTRGQAA